MDDNEKKGILKRGMKRPDWDQYYLNLVPLIGKRATCDRGRSGALLVRDHKIIASGYVGSTPGEPHCDDIGHEIITVWHHDTGKKSDHCDRTLHAEENVILQCAEFGIPAKGSTLYCWMTPCFKCARRIVRVGIVRVVAVMRYHDEKRTIDLFGRRGIEFKVSTDKVEDYKNE